MDVAMHDGYSARMLRVNGGYVAIQRDPKGRTTKRGAVCESPQLAWESLEDAINGWRFKPLYHQRKQETAGMVPAGRSG